MTNARSYSGIETYTDHKLVKTGIKFEWYRIKTQNEKMKPKIDIKRFTDRGKQEEYREEI